MTASESSSGSPSHVRIVYAVIALAVIAFGLTWRLAPLGLPPFLFKYGGSVTWAIMIYFVVALLLLLRAVKTTTALALAVATVTELSRLCHTPWLDAFRGSFAGAILLGKHFSLWNIVAYWLGIAAAALADAAIIRRFIGYSAAR
jgi:phosphoglycerol transferase MdoB-like AlkP superfamily enzyme